MAKPISHDQVGTGNDIPAATSCVRSAPCAASPRARAAWSAISARRCRLSSAATKGFLPNCQASSGEFLAWPIHKRCPSGSSMRNSVIPYHVSSNVGTGRPLSRARR